MGWLIVGHCPKCGAPIYAQDEDFSVTQMQGTKWDTEEPPETTYSCPCHLVKDVNCPVKLA